MAEWPCCHDPLRFSPLSLRFVPPPSATQVPNQTSWTSVRRFAPSARRRPHDSVSHSAAPERLAPSRPTPPRTACRVRVRGERGGLAGWVGGPLRGSLLPPLSSSPVVLSLHAKDSAGAGGPLREAFCPGPGEAAGRAAGRFPPSLCHGLGRNSNEPCGLANFFSKLLVSLLPDLAEYRKLSRNEGTRIQRKELCIIFFLKLTRLLTS